MTPMVDVTLVILIFFMVSAAALGPERLLRTVVGETPSTGSSVAADLDAFQLAEPRFRVVINADGSVEGAGVRGGDPASFADALLGALAGVPPERIRLSVEPAGAASWESVVGTIEVLKARGLSGVSLGAGP